MPAYHVAVTDVIPSGLDYISNSWDQTRGPTAALLDDDNPPVLRAAWPVIPPTVTEANPIRLRYNLVVPPESLPGQLYTNTITTTWTSLAGDPYADRRDGRGGVDDYIATAHAELALSEVAIDKSGPLTVTAGSIITYQLAVYNSGPYTAVQATVTDTMPFQIETLATSYAVAGVTGNCAFVLIPTGDRVYCDLGDVPVGVTARVVITGRVDAATPNGADLTNVAQFTVASPDGNVTNNTKSVETEVLTAADVAVAKRGPLTATAGSTLTYTVVITNNGPSVARDVDIKDLLPTGLTYVHASSSQGACVSSICQLGDVGVHDIITLVVTATVNSAVSGVLTNTARAFGDTFDPIPANNLASVATTVGQRAQLAISKVDLTDPVYAGDTYFYEVEVTNAGPSAASAVIFTDTLPATVSYAGGSAACSASSSGVIACTVGAL
ncbi:MAG: DUF11 domain-containing protein, partial [Caldilineaceae bacterium]|nr:DUF11 domain-containing protein [Caldilineaceae bacterium]